MGANCGKDQPAYQPHTYPAAGRYGTPMYHPGHGAHPAPGMPYPGPPIYADHMAYDPSFHRHSHAAHAAHAAHSSALGSHPVVDGWHAAGRPPPPTPPTPSTGSSSACRFGVECTDFSQEHRKRFMHPEGILLACQYPGFAKS